MVIKLDGKELKEMIMEKVKEELSQSEVFAGLIWHFCINSQDHFYKGEYYDLPVSFQYDNDGVSLLDVYYLQQRNQWSLISPDYKHILRIAPLVLKWMDNTYFTYVAAQQQMNASRKPRRRRGMKTRRTRQRPRKRAIAPSSSILTTPLSQPQSSPRQASKTQERQKEQGRKPTANSQVRADYEGQEQTSSNGQHR